MVFDRECDVIAAAWGYWDKAPGEIPASIVVNAPPGLDIISTMSPRTKRALANMNVTTVINLLNLTEDDFLKQVNCGRKGMNEIKAVLASHGLALRDNQN